MQLKFFITSYVNSPERRKYVAVWFSPIQERIQCWPAQYSYGLTVNSFEKAFAHVRNCLLMRKCRMCKNRIMEEQKHWRILHENDTKRKIQQNTTIILILMNLHATWLPHHPSSVIYSSYYTANFGTTADS